jgi:integrase
VHVYSDADCQLIIEKAGILSRKSGIRWDLSVVLALTTGMRRGEILNLIWSDIDFDFEKQTVQVRPKRDSEKTWEWQVKDADHRTLPLVDGLVTLLAKHQGNQPEGYPYVFVPPKRYERIQELRAQGKWSYADSRNKVVNNFTRHFKLILDKANTKGQFHDLRRTALTRFMNTSLTKHDIMAIAGHSQFETTERFYLAVKDGLVDRAREAMQTIDTARLLQICCRDQTVASNEKGQQS